MLEIGETLFLKTARTRKDGQIEKVPHTMKGFCILIELLVTGDKREGSVLTNPTVDVLAK